MEKVLVVGENSFIGSNLKKYDKVSYKKLNDVDFTKYDVVVNCALNPLYKIQKYREKIDVDWYVGRKACDAGCHYVMLSTSKVYGNSKHFMSYSENSEVRPYDFHSENKLNTEFKLLANYGNNITILRGSNIFGFEYGRDSFVGYCMTNLVNRGIIDFTISDAVRRDFLPIQNAVSLIEKICQIKPFGVFNLSSGIALPISVIAESLVKGYTYGGEINKIGWQLDRQFVLDNTKLCDELDVKIGPFNYKQIFEDLGKQLCKI